MAKRIAHALEVAFKHCGYFRNLLNSGLLYALEPQLDVVARFGVRIASKDGFEFFTQPPSNADLVVGFLNGLEDLVLFFRPILFVFQERIATVVEFLMGFRFPSAHTVNCLIEILDQVKPIMNQRGLR